MPTYKEITLSDDGKGFPLSLGELGIFELGFSEFGGGIEYDDGTTFAGLDNASQRYSVANNGSQAYAVIDNGG